MKIDLPIITPVSAAQPELSVHQTRPSADRDPEPDFYRHPSPDENAEDHPPAPQLRKRWPTDRRQARLPTLLDMRLGRDRRKPTYGEPVQPGQLSVEV